MGCVMDEGSSPEFMNGNYLDAPARQGVVDQEFFVIFSRTGHDRCNASIGSIWSVESWRRSTDGRARGSGVFPRRGRLIRWSGYAAVGDTR
jgi:hypothetical protein